MAFQDPEEEKIRQLEQIRAKFAASWRGVEPEIENPPEQEPTKPETSLFSMLVFWIVVMGAVHWGMKIYMQPKPAAEFAVGQWVIPRDRDGHSYVHWRR